MRCALRSYVTDSGKTARGVIDRLRPQGAAVITRMTITIPAPATAISRRNDDSPGLMLPNPPPVMADFSSKAERADMSSQCPVQSRAVCRPKKTCSKTP